LSKPVDAENAPTGQRVIAEIASANLKLLHQQAGGTFQAKGGWAAFGCAWAADLC
jgi:hypothetical protein